MSKVTAPPPSKVPKGLHSLTQDEQKVAYQVAKDYQIALAVYETTVMAQIWNNGKLEDKENSVSGNLDIPTLFTVITRADPVLGELIRKAHDTASKSNGGSYV